jgi:AraC family transcriptional regulator
MNKEIPVLRSLEIIESRITEKLTVENIARSVYFSKFHYGRLFREIMGESVMDYVTKRKLTLAGRALLETDASVLDIALKFGYDSHEGFTRSFKAYMGVTPTDYRKYSLSSISQKSVKGKNTMLYSKNTDEIIRELNDFFATAKETAKDARKNKNTVPEYAPFWNTIADTTDAFADKMKDVIERITSIADNPDEITNRFNILIAIEDIALQSNLLAFNTGLMVSRGQPEHIRAQLPLCEKYRDLARVSSLKSGKIVGFFNELSGLIFADMRKTADEKLRAVIQKGKSAADSIGGDSRYAYIRNEVECLVNELSSMPIDNVTVIYLEDCLFKLNVISFAAEMDITRSPKDKELFGGMAAFRESLSEAISFFKNLIMTTMPENTSDSAVSERKPIKHASGIAFQGNILLFYTRGEADKLGNLLDDEQKTAFEKICGKINDFIQFTRNATEKSAESSYKTIADMLYAIHADMTAAADGLKDRGGSVRFIAGEVKGLADSVMKCAVDEK